MACQCARERAGALIRKPEFTGCFTNDCGDLAIMHVTYVWKQAAGDIQADLSSIAKTPENLNLTIHLPFITIDLKGYFEGGVLLYLAEILDKTPLDPYRVDTGNSHVKYRKKSFPFSALIAD